MPSLLDYLASPDVVNIPAAQKEGLTIGQLANTQATSSLDLQQRRQMLAMMQDPRYAAAMGQMMAGAGGDANDWSGLFQSFPAAAGPALTQQLGMVKTMADIGKARADADKAQTSARTDQLTVLANQADGLAKSDGPLMPDKVMAFLRTAQYVGASPMMGDVVSAVKSGDEGAIRQSLLNFSQAGSTMAQRAGANKQNVEAGLAPQQFNLDRYKTMVDAAKAIGGEVKQDANGQLYIVRPMAGVTMPTPPGPAPVPGQAPPGATYSIAPNATMTPDQIAAVQADAAKSGYTPAPGAQAISAPPAAPAPASAPNSALPVASPVGVQGALSPAEAAQNAVRQKTLEASRTAAAAAQEAKLILPALRDTLAQGYTGTVGGSNAGKQLLNFAASYNLLSPDEIARLAETRMSDSLVTKLLGPMAHSLSQRGMTQQSQKLIENSKPGTENSTPVAMGMIDALMTDARNSINYDTALNKYVTTNPSDYGLSGWPAQVPKPELPPPQGKRASQLPPPSVANLGMKAYDVDTGRVYINRTGSKWELTQ